MQGLLDYLVAEKGHLLGGDAIERFINDVCDKAGFVGKRVLVIVPDTTRTVPLPIIMRPLLFRLSKECKAVDVMVALGTHPPMTDEAIYKHLGLTPEEHVQRLNRTKFFNHAWNDPNELKLAGVISSEKIYELSEGLFSMEVQVTLNKRVFDYDQLLIVGPVFPHEVAGFSGGNKYFFPGVSGPEVINFTHWLGALVTNLKTIGRQQTPVRKVIDFAATYIPAEKFCFSLVVTKEGLVGIYAGTPESAWFHASNHSRNVHIIYKKRPFHTVLSCSPAMYDDLWTGAKCMYKLEPVLADGGEIIIYAPHISCLSVTHGKLIREIGYHCVEYFTKQWDRFKNYPWGVLAHSTHLRGGGTWSDGIENDRVKVTLATGIDRDTCRAINLFWRDPESIDFDEFKDREDEGILYVPRAGEILYRLAD
jgi:nickel-dependent lactate racemase